MNRLNHSPCPSNRKYGVIRWASGASLLGLIAGLALLLPGSDGTREADTSPRSAARTLEGEVARLPRVEPRLTTVTNTEADGATSDPLISTTSILVIWLVLLTIGLGLLAMCFVLNRRPAAPTSPLAPPVAAPLPPPSPLPSGEVAVISDHVPSPEDYLGYLLVQAGRQRTATPRPTRALAPWQVGLSCVRGNVRTENQDYGVCFLIGARQVLIIADGCGGLPLGRQAAFLAVSAAARSVLRAGSTASAETSPEEIAARALRTASRQLIREGAKRQITTTTGGLRTTLIVVIADPSRIGHAYIGDGGGCVVRASGSVENFLTPQKASAVALNVLAASLGPTQEGEPVTGTMERQPGDLVLAGTDGIFDRVDDTFPRDILRGAIEEGGDLDRVTQRVTSELASIQDEHGYICDDNLTLGLLGDGTAPRLAAGFWSTPAEQAAA